MSLRLDDSLDALKTQPSATKLDNLETEVLRGIAAVREARTAVRAVIPTAAVAVVAAMSLGVAGGGVAATAAGAPQEISAFAVHSRLAPSTLLDSHG